MSDNTGKTEKKVQLKTIEDIVPCFRDEKEMTAWYDIGKGPNENFRETKVILLVGGTGAGKFHKFHSIPQLCISLIHQL